MKTLKLNFTLWELQNTGWLFNSNYNGELLADFETLHTAHEQDVVLIETLHTALMGVIEIIDETGEWSGSIKDNALADYTAWRGEK